MLPEVIAHRGASADRPEHTLAAYELAIDQGADGLECDIRLTRDGKLVCFHDRTVNRTTDGRGPVSTKSFAQLDALDHGDGHGALLFTDLLDLALANNVRLFVETKHPVRYGALVEWKLITLLRRRNLLTPPSADESPVVMMSFSPRAVHRVARIAANLPTVLLLDPVAARRFDVNLPSFAAIAGPGVQTLRQRSDYVRRMREQGKDVYTWTVDDPADMRWCAEQGVRYLATNTPDVARAQLTRRGERK